ncbi:DUF3048 domain-containing protein [Vallitalea pronyensis]|uniref:DUF3048 domain-containing protein n=1 Tax=Vallitalea pronyensis TaxID=1348613 RepID=A0A8J8ML49_9FIRM|nr:DUF3048 domain-containing protein [Vallitalea pronyensis]QUI23529.1 DUF3048 domain-containing protein [Vallitalea pronyensis]
MNKPRHLVMLKALMVVILLTMVVVTGCKKDKAQTNTENLSPETNESNESEEHEKDNETDIDDTIVVDEPTQEELEAEALIDTHEGEAINTLTGLWISEEAANRRPTGIMINNHSLAMPQSGIAQADIIYETVVEGGITRLFALFRDFDSEKIGPVRSARHYYLDFSFDHDAIYNHYGKSTYAKKKFSEWNAPNIDGLSGLDAMMTFQDKSRKRPHSTYTSFERLMKTWDAVGYRKENKEGFEAKFKFADEEIDLVSGEEATYLNLDYSQYKVKPWFEYNADDKLYYRFQFGKEHIDRETEEQLAFKNIVIQLTNMWVIKGDPYGCMDMKLVASGDGYYITNGKVEKMTWEKKSHYDPTLYYDEKGEEIKLNKGKTWVSVFPSNRKGKLSFTKE